jgi:hypothetical protein
VGTAGRSGQQEGSLSIPAPAAPAPCRCHSRDGAVIPWHSLMECLVLALNRKWAVGSVGIDQRSPTGRGMVASRSGRGFSNSWPGHSRAPPGDRIGPSRLPKISPAGV